MKKLSIILIILSLCFVSCNQNELTDAKTALKNAETTLEKTAEENKTLDSQVKSLQKENDKLKKERDELVVSNEKIKNKLHYFMNKNDTEIIDDSIYTLSNRHNILHDTYELSIVEKDIIKNKIGFELIDSNMISFTVSSDNKYIMVNYLDINNKNKQAIKLFDHDRNLIYSYYYDELIGFGMGESDIIHKGYFSDNNDYYYGTFGSEVDVSKYFIINIRTGEFSVFKYDQMDKYKEILKKNPSSRFE